MYNRLCGLVVRVSGYRYRGPGFDPRRYQFLVLMYTINFIIHAC